MENEQVDNSFTPEEALAAAKAREAAAQAPAPSEVVEEAQPEAEVVSVGDPEVVEHVVSAEDVAANPGEDLKEGDVVGIVSEEVAE